MTGSCLSIVDPKLYGGSLDGRERVTPIDDRSMPKCDDLGAVLATMKPDPAEEARFLVGMPMSYQEFSPSHHPTNPMHLAEWHLSLFAHDYTRSMPVYVGPDPSRSAGLGLLSDAFIREFFTKMDARGWKNADGTPIGNALKFTLDSFDEWRHAQLALPPNQRSCEFGDDGFPKELGVYNDYLWVAWRYFNWFFGDGLQNDKLPPRRYGNLADRGLVPALSEAAWKRFATNGLGNT